MSSKPSPLVFPKKGDAQPPADATGRAAIAEPAASPAPAPAAAPAAATRKKPAAAAPSTPAASSSSSSAAAAPQHLADLEGRDELVQINVTVPRWIRSQLHILRATGQAKTIKALTTEAIIRAVQDLAEKGRAQ